MNMDGNQAVFLGMGHVFIHEYDPRPVDNNPVLIVPEDIAVQRYTPPIKPEIGFIYASQKRVEPADHQRQYFRA